jgi:hypothetical protein
MLLQPCPLPVWSRARLAGAVDAWSALALCCDQPCQHQAGPNVCPRPGTSTVPVTVTLLCVSGAKAGGWQTCACRCCATSHV